MHCALQGNKISSGSNASYRKIVVALLVVAAGHEAKKRLDLITSTRLVVAYAHDGSKRKIERIIYKLPVSRGEKQSYTPLILSKGKPCTGKDL